MEYVSKCELREEQSVEDRVDAQTDETNSHSAGRSRQEYHPLPVGVEVDRCRPVAEPDCTHHNVGLPCVIVDKAMVAFLEIYALGWDYYSMCCQLCSNILHLLNLVNNSFHF